MIYGDSQLAKIILAGATGYMGQQALAHFVNAGHQVTALVRDPAKINNDLRNKVTVIVTDFQNPEQLVDDLAGQEILFSSLGLTHQRDGLTPQDVDFKLNQNLLHAAQQSNIQKFIYIHIFAAANMLHVPVISAKQNFVDQLIQSNLDYSIICPTALFNDMKMFMFMAQKGDGWVLGDGCYQINPIHGRDVAQICLESLSQVKCQIDVGGPEVFHYRDIMRLAYQSLGIEGKIKFFPLWLFKMIARILQTVTPLRFHGPVSFFSTVLTRSLVAPLYGTCQLKDFFAEIAPSY